MKGLLKLRAGGGRRHLCALVFALCGGAANAACYSVYDAEGALIFQDVVNPVPLDRRIGDVIPQRFGQSARMVFTPIDSDCAQVGVASDVDVMSGPQWDYIEMGMSPTGRALLANSPGDRGGWPSVGGGTSVGTGGGGHVIQVGKRGGRFYINSRGNRTYVER